MNLLPWRKPQLEERGANDPTLTFDALLGLLESFTYNGSSYNFLNTTTYGSSKQESIGPQLDATSALAYKSNAVVFACMQIRANLLSEGRFIFRDVKGGRPGNLFNAAEPLQRLRVPWPGGTTADLIKKMVQYVDLAGNAFVVRNGPGLALLRPDWVSIIIGTQGDPAASAWDTTSQVLGYAYYEGGHGAGKEPELFSADEVAHWAPIPDPQARFRGMSWITPLAREVMADKAMTEWKLTYFENAATPNVAVKLDVPDLDALERWVEKFGISHDGARNAGKTMYMSAGSDVTPIGANLKDIDFSSNQESGEKRVCAAAGVPIILTSLNLDSATFSNYQLAMRFLADMTARPLWRDLCGSLANIITVPSDSELWIDDRDIAALRGDQLDAANIQQLQSASMLTLINSGFEPDTVIDAVTSGDLSRLEHTGLVSVQLQPPGAALPPDIDEAPAAGDTAPTPSLPPGGAQKQLPAGRGDSPAEEHPAVREVMPSTINITLPEQQPPVVNITNELQPANVSVTNEVQTPHVRNEITVEPTPVTVQNTLAPAKVTVTNEVQTPTVEVTIQEQPEQPKRMTVERTGGLITGITLEDD